MVLRFAERYLSIKYMYTNPFNYRNKGNSVKMALNQFVDKINKTKNKKKQSVYLFTEKSFRAWCSWSNLKVESRFFTNFL